MDPSGVIEPGKGAGLREREHSRASLYAGDPWLPCKFLGAVGTKHNLEQPSACLIYSRGAAWYTGAVGKNTEVVYNHPCTLLPSALVDCSSQSGPIQYASFHEA